MNEGWATEWGIAMNMYVFWEVRGVLSLFKISNPITHTNEISLKEDSPEPLLAYQFCALKAPIQPQRLYFSKYVCMPPDPWH